MLVLEHRLVPKMTICAAFRQTTSQMAGKQTGKNASGSRKMSVYHSRQ